MSIGAANHAAKAHSPLTSPVSSQSKPQAKKADNDADDRPAAKAAPAALATTGPGQVVDRKV
ncbi:hypothetical protein [Methylobacterium brachiatum]